MTWFRHGATDTHPQRPVLDTAEDRCVLRLPLESQDARICAWLHLEYEASDPLEVSLSIRSPSGAPVVERTMLRRDLRKATYEPLLLSGLTVGPAGVSGFVAFVFHEQSIAVPVTVPASAVSDFLRGCDGIVRMTDRAETDALTASLARAMQGWS